MKKIILLVGGTALGFALGFLVWKVAVSALEKIAESAREDADLSLEEMMVGFAEMPPATPFAR